METSTIPEQVRSTITTKEEKIHVLLINEGKIN
jgi:hypothetical protein